MTSAKKSRRMEMGPLNVSIFLKLRNPPRPVGRPVHDGTSLFYYLILFSNIAIMWLFLKDQSLLIWLGVVAFGLFAAVRVVLETRSPSKTAAYLLLIILFPVGGPLLYFLVGVNYRKRRIYSK